MKQTWYAIRNDEGKYWDFYEEYWAEDFSLWTVTAEILEPPPVGTIVAVHVTVEEPE